LLLALAAWSINQKVLMVIMLATAIFLVFDFTFGSDPHHKDHNVR